jgi:glycosyltransferase involved in cell wall biosynthesis
MVPDVVIPHYRGSSTHVYEVARHLARKGNHVTVVARRLSRSQPRWDRLGEITVYRTFQGIFFEPPLTTYAEHHADQRKGGSSLVRHLYALYLKSFRAVELGLESSRALSGQRVDVVLERETAFGAGAVLSRLVGAPLVLEVIGPRISSLSLQRASLVLAYSSRMVRGLVPPERLRMVSAAVNLRLFRPDPVAGEEIRLRYNLRGKKVIGYVGTFPEWHGVRELISSMKRTLLRCPDAALLMVGPYFEATKELAKEKGLEGAVVFSGPVQYESVPAYIAACDVLCAPYNPAASPRRQREGIGAPLKVLEYMACQKPVISTDVPPIPDVVDDGVNGLLVRPGDVEDLSEAIVTVLEDGALASRLGERGRVSVEKEYSWEAFSEELNSDLMKVVSGPGSPGRSNVPLGIPGALVR